MYKKKKKRSKKAVKFSCFWFHSFNTIRCQALYTNLAKYEKTVIGIRIFECYAPERE